MKFLDAPRRLAGVDPLLRGNKPESFSGLRFQKHQFEGLHIFKRRFSDNHFCDFHDYEQSQARVTEAASRFDKGDRDYAGLPDERAIRKAKAEMELPDDEAPDEEPAIGFEESISDPQERIPHLEIGAVVLNRKDRIITVSTEPPGTVVRPSNKCPHGCWVASACRVCTPTEIPNDGSDWDNRVDTAFSMVNSCALCDRKINRDNHYCRDCAETLILTTVEISFEKPNVEGAKAEFQEKRIRQGERNTLSIPAVTFDEVRTYAATILHFQLCERLGREDLPPIITNQTGPWLYKNCQWLRRLFRRFWFYTHDCTLEQIGEIEGVQRNAIHGFIADHSARIRTLFDALGGEE